MAEHVILVGLMGSGKTTVGRSVAAALGRPFIDSDNEVEQSTGRTVREIWQSEGEQVFRRLEAEALETAVACAHPAVIAAAGGVVLSAENRAVLNRSGTVVWLDGSPEALAARAAEDDHRPLLDDDPLTALRAMAQARRRLYEEVADHVVSIDHRTVAEIAGEIVELVR